MASFFVLSYLASRLVRTLAARTLGLGVTRLDPTLASGASAVGNAESLVVKPDLQWALRCRSERGP